MHNQHRDRMRQRYLQNGLDNFAMHEVLELMLYYCIPRQDVNPIAHALIQKFGSLHATLDASPEEMMQVKGIGQSSATFLSLIPPLLRKYQQSILGDKPLLKNHVQVADYCRTLFVGQTIELFYIVALDASMHALGHTLISKGSLSKVAAYPRQVVKAAIALNAHGVILCHNHPGGSPQPSDSDLALTTHLYRVLNDIDIVLYDHLIVCPTSVTSLKQAGFLLNTDC